MTKQSTICAIIPTYNRADFLSRCLDSLINQTYPLDQIIVVSDGSTDHTDEIAEGYKDKITYIKKENGGKSSALNLALPKVKADYVWICDDDDYADPKGAEVMASALDQNPDASFVYGRFKVFKSKADGTEEERIPGFWKREEEPNSRLNFLEDMFTFQFSMLTRNETYKKVGLFNEELIRSQDYEMTIRLLEHGKAVEIPDIIFYQREHDGVRGGKKDSFKKSESLSKWMKYDQIFFGRIAQDYPLDIFTPTFALNWNEPLKQRASFIQKALILAKRGLWSEAIDTLEQATRITNEDLTEEEKHILRVVIHSEIPWKTLAANKSQMADLGKIYKSSETQKTLVRSLLNPTRWMARNALKQGRMDDFLVYVRLAISVMGILDGIKYFVLK